MKNPGIPKAAPDLRRHNMARLLSAVLDGADSKRGLQERTGLSWGTVSALANELLRKGYIVETGKEGFSAGRKTAVLDVNAGDHYVVGLDINASGLKAVVCDLKARVAERFRESVANPERNGVIGQLKALIASVLDRYRGKKFLALGVAVQGKVDTEAGVSLFLPYFAGWTNIDLRGILEREFDIPAYIYHDPDCVMASLSEPRADDLNYVLLRVEKGIGMSVATGGRILTGSRGINAEIGHTAVDPEGIQCYCGNRGCLEAYVNAERILNEYKRGADLESFLAAARRGDDGATGAALEAGRYLGLAISTICNIFNPATVFICSSYGQIFELARAELEKQIKNHVFGGKPPRVAILQSDGFAAAAGGAVFTARRLIDESRLF
ncbi:xylose repressor [Clostridia bacterium]|nr:xylose repressor [Clostridia bacterium]